MPTQFIAIELKGTGADGRSIEHLRGITVRLRQHTLALQGCLREQGAAIVASAHHHGGCNVVRVSTLTVVASVLVAIGRTQVQ